MAFTDDFSGRPDQITASARNAAAITKNDSTDLTNATKAIYVGGAGDIKVDMVGGQSAVTLVGVPAGTILPIRATRVYSTGTGATNMVALW